MNAPRRLAAALVLLLALAAGAPPAAAQNQPTAPFQGAYRAYDYWNAWKWWLPDACTVQQRIHGSEPAAPGRYPVVVYLHGVLADWAGNDEGRRVAELAARHGFVAAAFTFDSWVVNSVSSVDGNARCMFSPGTTGNALASVCARPKADCSRGIVVAGFSAGGAIAGRARNFADQVRAAWLLGVTGPAIPEALAAPAGSRALPNDRIRISVGRSDVVGTGELNRLTGRSCAASPCLGPDGSGYAVVEHSDVADGVADHCWWQSVTRWAPTNSCTWTPTFDPGFVPPSRSPWSLTTNLDWLRSALGPQPPR